MMALYDCGFFSSSCFPLPSFLCFYAQPSLADPKNEDFKILQHVRVLAQIASDDMMSESLADELENETALIAQLKARLNMVKDQAPLLEEIDNETQFVQELTDTYEVRNSITPLYVV